MSQTPNVVITNPTTRRILTVILSIVSILAACAAVILAFWPELAGLRPDPARVIATVNAIVALLSGTFGLAVVNPNIPKREAATSAPPTEAVEPDNGDDEDQIEADAAADTGYPPSTDQQ